MYSIFELNEKSLDDLKMIATEMGIDDENRDRTQLIYDIIDHQVDHPDIKKAAKTKSKKQKPQNNEKPETKPEPVKEVAEKVEKDINEKTAEPDKEVEAKEPAKAEQSGKRTKRPRISKSAETSHQEKQSFSTENLLKNL